MASVNSGFGIMRHRKWVGWVAATFPLPMLDHEIVWASLPVVPLLSSVPLW